ncbi:MAG: hypothetical protein KAG95_03405 [Bacteroidales bacterium]|nr:hypothetical protein [Bacteroidales bacterium]
MNQFKKIKEIIIWLSIITYLVIALSFVSEKEEQIHCSSVEVAIVDDSQNHFIKEDDVISMIYDKGGKLLGYPFDSINLAYLEELINNNPSIKKSEVYRTINGILKIDIEQRTPIVRIINFNNESYYIDEQGALMPLSNNYTARVLVVNGDINEPYQLNYSTDILSSSKNDELNRHCILCDIYNISKFIYNDEFWDSQIEQIYVKDNEYKLIPRVGSQIILFGGIENLEEKFVKLKALYEKGFLQVRWNKYKTINLKYSNQIICIKK